MKKVSLVSALLFGTLLIAGFEGSDPNFTGGNIGKHVIEEVKKTSITSGDDGVYKGYVEQKSRGTIPPIVITTTNATTKYNYVPPPPPPAPAGVTPEATASGVRFFIMGWGAAFGVSGTNYCDTWTGAFYNLVPNDGAVYKAASGTINMTAKASGNSYSFTGKGFFTPTVGALVAAYGASANFNDF